MAEKTQEKANSVKKDTKFKKGNTVGIETRFQKGNQVSNKYKPEYCERIIDYFLTQKPFATFELFAAEEIGVNSSTLLNWCNKYARFRDAYARAKSIQLGRLKILAATNQCDSNFVKFMCINDHDMRDKATVEQVQEKPFEVNINVRKN